LSGIAGIWNLDGKPADEKILRKMSAMLGHRGADGEGIWLEGGVGLACQLLRVTPESLKETQPFHNSRGHAAVFDGRLDNREEIISSLGNSVEVSAEDPDIELILAAYEHAGERFVPRLAGDFAFALFDTPRRQFFLVKDPIGVRPLYYTNLANTFLFASEIKALLAHPDVICKPNEDAVAAFVRRGPATEDRGQTVFDGIFSLPGGHFAAITPRGLTVERYWDFDGLRKTRLGSFQEYGEAFKHLFFQAVRRRMRSAYPIAFSVSGGLDSSAVFSTAQTLRNESPTSFPALMGITYTQRDGTSMDEDSYVCEIEKKFDVRIERMIRGPLGYVQGSKEEVWFSEIPYINGIGMPIRGLHKAIHERGARALLTGDWGDDVLESSAQLLDLSRRFAWRKVRAYLKEQPKWYTDADPKSFRQDFFQGLVREHIPRSLRPLVRRFRARFLTFPWDCPWYSEEFRRRMHSYTSQVEFTSRPFASLYSEHLYKSARSWYGVSTMGWLNKVASARSVEPSFPFLDRDLLVFLMNIPGEIQTWKGVPKSILREAMRGVMPDAIVERRWKADARDWAVAGMTLDYNNLLECLQSRGMLTKLGYVQPGFIENELPAYKEKINDPDCVATWRLPVLLAFELWLQVFFMGNLDLPGQRN
jgi:asparagine synthase (glutamine-hydrolysing)